jgi:hypothetical protein
MYNYYFFGSATGQAIDCPLHTSKIRYLSWGGQVTFVIEVCDGRVDNCTRF